jgi:hypothetical protein
MNKFRILQIILVAAGAALFAFRYQSLRELKAEEEQLQKTSSLESTTQPAPVVANPLTNAGLSAVERNELLRLRGQIGVLRRELAQETNR